VVVVWGCCLWLCYGCVWEWRGEEGEEGVGEEGWVLGDVRGESRGVGVEGCGGY